MDLFISAAWTTLLGLTASLAAETRHKRLSFLGIERLLESRVAWFVFLSTCMIALNQFAPGYILYPVFIATQIFLIISFSRHRVFQGLKSHLPKLAAATITSALVPALMFQTFSIWLRQGQNLDQLFYYQGLWWSQGFPTLAGESTINGVWHLGPCDWKAFFIGPDCSLFRGGTYSIMGYQHFLAPDITGSSPYMIFVFIGIFIWLALKDKEHFEVNKVKSSALRNWVIFIGVLLSPGLISSLGNANLATLLPATTLVVILIISPLFESPERWYLHALALAFTAHTYTEGVIYLGLFIVVLEFFLIRKSEVALKSYIRGLTSAVLSFAALSNASLYLILKTAGFVSQIKDDAERSYYFLDHPLEWPAGFFTAELQDLNVPASEPIWSLLGWALFLVVGYLVSRTPHWRPAAALLAVSILFAAYVQVKAYQYGEHKILQLFGPAWTATAILAIARFEEGRFGGKRVQRS